MLLAARKSNQFGCRHRNQSDIGDSSRVAVVATRRLQTVRVFLPRLGGDGLTLSVGWLRAPAVISGIGERKGVVALGVISGIGGRKRMGGLAVMFGIGGRNRMAGLAVI